MESMGQPWIAGLASASLRGAALESGASSVSNWLSLGFQIKPEDVKG